MATPPTLQVLHSSLLPFHLHNKISLSQSPNLGRIRRSPPYTRIRALELDQNTVVAISVGVVSVAVGLGIPIFYEAQIDNAAKRDNTQPCFPCNGSGAQQCRFCTGKGTVTVIVGGGESEVSRCINCEGNGSLTCTTCQGSGIQPRYLDRRSSKNEEERRRKVMRADGRRRFGSGAELEKRPASQDSISTGDFSLHEN